MLCLVPGASLYLYKTHTITVCKLHSSFKCCGWSLVRACTSIMRIQSLSTMRASFPLQFFPGRVCMYVCMYVKNTVLVVDFMHICVCMCACICVCICTYMSVYVYIHTYAYFLVKFCAHSDVHIYIHLHTYIDTCKDSYIHTYINISTQRFTYTCILIHT